MTEERLGRGELTTKAYTVSNDFNIVGRISTTSQWTVVDNYTINATFNGGAYLSSYGTFDSASWKYATFSGYSGLGYKLEYSIVVYAYNSNTKLYESAWIPNDEICYLGVPDWVTSGSSNTRQPRFEIYLRRNEFNEQGERRWLVPSDMRPSTCIRFLTGYQDIEEQTLPSDWFATTSATFQNPMDTYTTIIPTDYDISSSQYDPLLEIPSKIDTAINFIILGFGRIMNFRYISFVVCFVLIVGLVAWLIH